MAMTVLITGGAGFIGSHLADQLLATGHRMRARGAGTHRVNERYEGLLLRKLRRVGTSRSSTRVPPTTCASATLLPRPLILDGRNIWSSYEGIGVRP